MYSNADKELKNGEYYIRLTNIKHVPYALILKNNDKITKFGIGYINDIYFIDEKIQGKTLNEVLEKLLTKILCFKLYQVANPFKLSIKELVYTNQVPVNWQNDNPMILSESLNNQCKINFSDFMSIKKCCEKSEKSEIYTWIYDNGALIPYFYGTEGCDKFENIKSNYNDVMIKDKIAFNDMNNMDVELHAVVLTNNNKYYGHIYTWVSPVDKDYCLAIGIRGRIDAIFKREVKNVSHKLLEGVRRFAVNMGCKYVIIPRPLPIMEQILPTLGFKPTKISNALIGKSVLLIEQSGECDNCYILEDINKIITDIKVNIIQKIF